MDPEPFDSQIEEGPDFLLGIRRYLDLEFEQLAEQFPVGLRKATLGHFCTGEDIVETGNRLGRHLVKYEASVLLIIGVLSQHPDVIRIVRHE